MIPTPKIPIGIGPPMVLPVPLSSLPVAQGGTDLTTLTGVQYRVWGADGVERTTPTTRWPGVIDAGGAATSLPTHYAFTGTEFDPNYGIWKLAPVGLVSGGGLISFRHVDFELVRIP